MRSLFSTSAFQSKLLKAQTDPVQIESSITDLTLPEQLKTWFNRLFLLKGVPFQYLVPDEGMLPAESIRFFYVDMNWIDALVDGAYSIGRNLTNLDQGLENAVERVSFPKSQSQIKAVSHQMRSTALGVEAPQTDLQVVSGFLMRSSLVKDYPGMGVNAYPAGGAPGEGNIQLLDILRLEQLGPDSDTLLCLIDGDCQRIDVHEAPEVLHYGLDSYQYDANNQQVSAEKVLHTFTQNGSQVDLSGNTVHMSMNQSFRNQSPRVVKMASLADQIAQQNNLSTIDAAQMGFEMTEGVGMVSFNKQNSQQ